jgi:TRAP transporter TAXI family solute receptor
MTKLLFVATLVGALFAAGTVTAETEMHLISIGTGGKNGVYYAAGGAICQLVNRHRLQHGVRCATKSTEGSVANLNSIRAGNLDMAVVQSDWQYHAYTGTGFFEPAGPDTELRSMFSLYAEPFTVVARRGAGIRTIDDLKGKRVDIGGPGSGNRATAEIVFATLGWTTDDLTLVAGFDSSEQIRALCGGELDAVVSVVGHPNRSIREMASSCDVDLVPVTGPAIDRLVAANPYYWHTTIPGGLYPGNPEAVKTFGPGATVVTSARVETAVVYEVVKAVFDNFDEIKKLHPAFASLDKKRMVEIGLTAPLHAGALQFYREAGLN